MQGFFTKILRIILMRDRFWQSYNTGISRCSKIFEITDVSGKAAVDYLKMDSLES